MVAALPLVRHVLRALEAHELPAPACACPAGRGHEANRATFCRTMDAVEAALGEEEGPYFLRQARPRNGARPPRHGMLTC